MVAQQIVFWIAAAITLGSAVIVVTYKNLFHAALAMMASFLGVAILYVLLEAGFFAAVQLLVYIGAISILVIFAIMMTRRLMQTREPAYNTQWAVGLGASLLVFVLFAIAIIRAWGTGFATTPEATEAVSNSVTNLGEWLVRADGYVIPFELASVLLLAALIGSIVVAYPKERS